jgi:hypothetical protein
MSPTLLEFAVAIVLIIVAWQIGVTIAPTIIRWLRSLKRDVDEAAEEALSDLNQHTPDRQHKEEHSNGTRR